MEDFYLGGSMSGGVRRKRMTRSKIGGAISGGCCPYCMQQRGGMQNPHEMMYNVLKHAEMGNITGGAVANMIVDYAGNGMYGEGFFDDLWSGIKKGVSTIASVAKPVLSFIPHPAAQIASSALGAMGAGRRKRVMRRKRVLKRL